MGVVLLLAAVACMAQGYPTTDPATAAAGLLKRVLPELAPKVTFELVQDPSKEKNGVMQLSNDGQKVIIRGSSAIDMASGANWYMNDYLNITIDWNTYGKGQLAVSTFPLPQTTPLMTRKSKWGYYMNVCTYGYSMAFVPWTYWVEHIDWMALNGINLPLAFVGQEYVWTRVFAKYNLTLDDLTDFYSGPAFLPWFRMGNMQGWGGPITKTWVDGRYQLQVQILSRMRELGMKPVLPAFAGHIPKAFTKKFPQAKVSRSSNWGGFGEQYGEDFLLDSSDPLYKELGEAFIREQAAVFGTDHIYNCDTFNEMSPASGDPTYLKNSAEIVYTSMVSGDPDAIWLMQGWLFHSKFWTNDRIKAYLSGVPNDKMWILDLNSEASPVWSRTESFYGKPFIWCTLLNYGGQQQLNGNLPRIKSGMADAQANSTMIGVGITMEGIWTDYIEYEFTLKLAWSEAKDANIDTYTERFGTRRYGKSSPGAVAAWKQLGSTVYAGSGGFRGSLISSLPSLKTPSPVIPGYTRYSQSGFWKVYTAKGRASVQQCAQFCSAEKTCKAFEVYVDTPPLFGNCYIFTDLSQPFEKLAPCMTYVRNEEVPALAATDPALRAVMDSQPAPHSLSLFADILQKLLSAKGDLAAIPSYRFDVVDVTRQAMAVAFTSYVSDFQDAMNANDTARINTTGAKILEFIDDYDSLLGTDYNFMLGRWIHWARGWGTTTEESNWLEWNARNQITLWGPNGNINDYAKKEWSGLVSSYHKKRWELAINMVKNGSWASGQYATKVLNEVEQPWQKDLTPFPTTPTGDPVTVSQAMFDKYLSSSL